MKDTLKYFRLNRKLRIDVPETRQTIFTDRYRYVYLRANAIYFSQYLTDNPNLAFRTSGAKLFFRSIPNVSQAYYAIRRSAKEGFNRIIIKELGDFGVTIRAQL